MRLMSVICIDRERKRRFAKYLLFDVCICEINRSARQTIDVFTMKKRLKNCSFFWNFNDLARWNYRSIFFRGKINFRESN